MRPSSATWGGFPGPLTAQVMLTVGRVGTDVTGVTLCVCLRSRKGVNGTVAPDAHQGEAKRSPCCLTFERLSRSFLSWGSSLPVPR